MPRYKGERIIDVGPRSAHIAGLRYISFAGATDVADPTLVTVRPKPDDPADYLGICIKGNQEPSFTFTTTEAANILGFMKEYGKAQGSPLKETAAWLAEEFGTSPDKLAGEILEVASVRVIDVVKDFIAEYKLEKNLLSLIGGGGGAEAVVPFAAQKLGMEYRTAANAEVISAIGVALGLIQDTIERSIMNPTDADILNIRNEAMQSVLRMGAAADTVEVRVEVDTKQKRVIATASGAPEMRQRSAKVTALSEEEMRTVARRSCNLSNGDIDCAGGTEFLKVYQGRTVEKKLFGLFSSERKPVRVIDREGVIRLKLNDCTVHAGDVSSMHAALGKLVDEFTMYGDAGGLQPDVFVVVSGRIIDLSGLISKDQVLSILRAETQNISPQEPAVALVAGKQ